MLIYDSKKIFQITYPLVVGMIVQLLIGMMDTAFLGRVGTVELGASAIATLVYVLFFMIIQSFAVGAQIVTSQRNGEKQYKKIAPIVYQTSNFSLIFSILCILCFIFYGKKGVGSFIESQTIADAILVYLIPRSFGLIFAGGNAILRAFFTGTTNNKPIFWASLISLISNLILNYWLIFGGFGIPPLGLCGAAIASVISELLSFLFLLIIISQKQIFTKYGFQNFHFWNNDLFKEIYRLSIWVMLPNIVGWGVWLYFFVEIEKYGKTDLAISNIIRSISNIPYMFIAAIGMATSSMVGNLIGMDKTEQIKGTIHKIIKVFLLPYYGFLLAMLIFPNAVLHIYTNDEMIIEMSLKPFYAMMLTTLPQLPAYVYFYAMYGIGETRKAFSFDILVSVIYALIISVATRGLHLSITYCWTVELVSYSLLFILSYNYIRKSKYYKTV